MQHSHRHRTWVATMLALAAVVLIGLVAARADTVGLRPTMEAIEPAQTVAAPAGGPAASQSGLARDAGLTVAPRHAQVGEVIGAVVQQTDSRPVLLGSQGTSLPEVWSAIPEVGLSGSVDPEGPDSQTMVSNTDPAPADVDHVPVATTATEPEPNEIEHSLSHIPDPPDVGASQKREKFVIEQEEHDPWFAVRRCESHDKYGTNTGNGFYGAYQFTASTWDWVAGKIGRRDLVGIRPDQAKRADQDRMAQALAFEVPGGGLHHWPVCGRLYG